jgi:hypothetical protein
MKAEVIYLYAYDIAQEADLAAIEASLRGSAEWFDLGRLKDAPRDFPVYRPLSIQINETPTEGAAGSLMMKASVKLFSVGALSVKIRILADVDLLMDLYKFRDLVIKDGSTLESHAHKVALQVFGKIKPNLVSPVTELPQPEGYTVFCVSPTEPEGDVWLRQHEREVAALLVGESDSARLSAQEVQETVGLRYSYYRHDLVVVDWDAALVVDLAGDYNDTLYVMEMANLQLEELRAYDRMLDQSLDKAYDDAKKTARVYDWGARRRVLNELRTIRMDVTKVADEISNITKFFGDWHLARVYMGCAARFHLEDWERSVSRKLRALDGLYTMLQADSNNWVMLILEASIVALFIIDLVIIVWLGKA